MKPKGLGCVIEPPMLGSPNIDPMLGTEPLPEQFIVPSWRDCFDVVFKTIPAVIRPRILDQGPIDSCVGHATAVQKSAQEKVPISPREIFRIAKTLDGNGLNSFGTSLSAGQDAVIRGVAEDQLVIRDPLMPRVFYVSQDDVTDQIRTNREKHKGKTSYFVPRTSLQRVLFEMKIPIVTSSMWYEQDNLMGDSSIMALPSSLLLAGHAFACIGWVKRVETCLVMVNSFGPNFGDNGLFYVPVKDVMNRLSNAYVAVDTPPDLAAIIALYNGKDVIVRGKPEHYRIENGKKRKYPDEVVWWAHGRLFGIDIYEIDEDDLKLIPPGPDVSIDEAPFNTRELVRQIRQFYGHL